MSMLQNKESNEKKIKQNNNYCVYIHINKLDDKRYIGITCQEVNKRWRLGEGYKGSPYFYNAIKKYTWDGFEHIVLFDNLSEIEAKTKEIELIKKYKTINKKYGYNRTVGGDGACGYKHTLESKQKMSNARVGIKYSQEHRAKMSKIMTGREMTDEWKQRISESHIGGKNPSAKPVVQLDKFYKLIKEFECARHAEKELGVNVANISQSCLGKSKSAGGFVFMFKKDYELQKEDLKGKMVEVKPYRKPVVQFSLCGEELRVFESISQASKQLKIDSSSISDVCFGKQNTAGKYKWAFV